MSVEVKYAIGLDVKETVALALDLVSASPTIAHLSVPSPVTLNASSTPAVTKVYGDTVAHAAGVVTVDLTSLVGAMGSAVDFSGLKVQFAYIFNPVGNTVLTVDVGVADGYELFGAADGKIYIPAGGTYLAYNADALDDVGATDKDIDFAGAGVETFNIVLVAG